MRGDVCDGPDMPSTVDDPPPGHEPVACAGGPNAWSYASSAVSTKIVSATLVPHSGGSPPQPATTHATNHHRIADKYRRLAQRADDEHGGAEHDNKAAKAEPQH